MKREELYRKVWEVIRIMTADAAPGSITPETISRVAVDVVLTELRRAGAITPTITE